MAVTVFLRDGRQATSERATKVVHTGAPSAFETPKPDDNLGHGIDLKDDADTPVGRFVATEIAGSVIHDPDPALPER